jgi:riboflavin biosynthesis pyrimidine reductase
MIPFRDTHMMHAPQPQIVPSHCVLPILLLLLLLLLQAAPTIVMTQRGARKHFQQFLRSKGVEVIEFDFLTPDAVADYCYERGFLQVILRGGGTGWKDWCCR